MGALLYRFIVDFIVGFAFEAIFCLKLLLFTFNFMFLFNYYETNLI